MPRLQALLSPRLTTLMLGLAALALVASIIAFPDGAFQASLGGLHLWWKLVFPTLLPFLIVTELLRGTGFLHGLGALMEPLLRLVFRLPGASGWALALGFTAGMPAGASAVTALHKEGLLRRDEAERLLGHAHLMSPVFLISVVGAGFLQDASAGLALALLHYGSAMGLMLLQRLTPGSAPSAAPLAAFPRRGWLQAAWHAYHEAKARDGRTFGKLLGDAVSSGVQQLFLIGGLMMMFSVLLHTVTLSGLPEGLAAALSWLGLAAGAAKPFAAALIAGLFEPHLGAYALSRTASGAAGPLPFALLSLALAWGGLSAHAQTQSLTRSAGLRYSKFLASRLQHGGLSFLLTLLCWKPLTAWLRGEQPVFAHSTAAGSSWAVEKDSLWPWVSPMMLQLGVVLLVLLMMSVFTAFLFYQGRGRKPM